MMSMARLAAVSCVSALIFAMQGPVSYWSVPVGGESLSNDMMPVMDTIAIGRGHFIENVGQLSNPDIHYYAWMGGTLVGFGESAVSIRLTDKKVVGGEDGYDGLAEETSGISETQGVRVTLVRLSFENSKHIAPFGRGELPYRSAFFFGNERSRWRTDVRSYEEVVFTDIYERIDLVYRSTEKGLKYDFVVHPGGDPNDIVLRYNGVNDLRVFPNDVRIVTAIGELHDSSIVGVQSGRILPCSFIKRGALTHGFNCIGWDGAEDLVIDPLMYSTYFGGAAGWGGGRDSPAAVAVDINGDIYVSGETESTDFPATSGTFDSTFNGSSDAYIIRIRPAGNGTADLLYSAYLGGDGWDLAADMGVRAPGVVYLAGRTRSTDFPTTAGAFDRQANITPTDGFLSVLAIDGDGQADLLYSTYIGGSGGDEVRGMAIDGSGRANMCGLTNSTDYPVTTGAYDVTLNGSYDAFLSVLDPVGSGSTDLAYSTLVGGNGDDYCYDVALDGGRAYLTGFADGIFPTTPGAYNGTSAGSYDGFLGVISPSGLGAADFLYGTMFGGTSSETPYGIATFSGDAFITGYTYSANFPTTAGSFDPVYNASSDGFLVLFRPLGGGVNDLAYSTYLGGPGVENPDAVAVDITGNAYVTGQTASSSYPVTPDAFQSIYGGTEDVFLTEIVPAGGGVSDLVYSTFIGGGGEDEGHAVALDSVGDVYLAVRTFTGIYPTTPGAYSETPVGSVDIAVTKLRLGPNLPPLADAGADHLGTRNASAALDGRGSSDPDGVPLRFSWSFVSGPSAPTIVNSSKPLASFTPAALGTYTFNLTIRDGDGATDNDLVDVLVSNVPPVADVSVLPPAPRQGQTAVVTGNSSGDADGSIIRYNFTFGDGSSTENTIGYVAHSWALQGVYQVNITVTDGDGAADTASVSVTVGVNLPPVADAGPDASYPKNGTIELNGSASSDPNGDPVSFSWKQVSGTPVSLVNATTPVASVHIPGIGVYAFRLWVNDSFGGSGTDTVQVTMTNTAPVANAGSDKSQTKNSIVTLNGTGSYDSDGDQLSFAWAQLSGSSVSIVNSSTSVASILIPLSGIYTFGLWANDSFGGTGTDVVQVTMTNTPPIAEAGADVAMPRYILVSLDGRGSSDADGDSLSCSWNQTSGPVVALSTADAPVATFTPTSLGVYAFELTVNDGDGGVDSDTVTVTVFNRAPSITSSSPATATVTVVRGADLPLSVVAADPDSDPLAYSWMMDGLLQSVTIPSFTFVSQTLGTHTVNVTVSDGDLTDKHSWTVTVEEIPPVTPPSSEFPLMLIGLAIAVIAMVMVVALWWIRKKKASRKEFGDSDDTVEYSR